MEGRLKFFPLLSLKQTALRTTAVLLWKGFLAADSRINRAVPYHTSRDRVIGKVSQLELPELLKKQVADVVILVGFEMGRWKEYLGYSLFNKYQNPIINSLSRQMFLHFSADGVSNSSTFHWTTAGRIDYRKTMKELHSNRFSVEELYEMACDYCLEDRIALLWEQLPNEAKEYFSDENKIYLALSFQWPHILKGEQSKLNEWSREKYEMNFNQYSFEISAENGKKNAAEYFYQKLTLEEREASVMRSFSKLFKSIDLKDDFDDLKGETFCYLLTLMTPERQMELLTAHPIHLFFCFFDMIWPDLFLENAPLIWKLLPPKDYAYLQQVMAEKIFWKDNYSPEKLMKFFISSPPGFKKCLGHESKSDVSLARSFLSLCFDRKDSESVKGLFQSLDVADRVKLVFNCSVSRFLVQGIGLKVEWPMVELCLREAALPRGERERLKKHIVRVFGRRDPKFVSQWKLKRLYDFLDAPDASSDEVKRGKKRKLENCSPE